MSKPTTPNPGSPEAREIGCNCPVMDNGNGRGHMGNPDLFVMAIDCPVHGPEITKEADHG